MTTSAFIICYNEEARIEACLKSVSWCDEIIVVDSGSSDKTVEIARRYTDKIYQRSWTNYVEQKQFALEKCTSEWVLNIDSDEEVSDELRDEFLAQAAAGIDPEVNGFLLNRVVYYLGRFWRRGGWYPENRLRIARRSVAMIEGFLVHEKMTAPGKILSLKGELYHYTFDSISDQIRRIDAHSTLHARAMFLEGKRSGLTCIVLYPLARFFKFLFIRRAYLEGIAGIGVAHLEALATLLKYFKLWELERASTQKRLDSEKSRS